MSTVCGEKDEVGWNLLVGFALMVFRVSELRAHEDPGETSDAWRESATDQGSAPLYSRFLVVTCATRAGSPTCQHTYMHAVICVSLLSYMYECEYSSSSWAQLELDRGI